MSCGDAGGDPGGFFFSCVFVNMGDDLGRGQTPPGVRPRYDRYEKSPLNQFHASLMGFVLIVGTLVIFSALGIILSI